MIHPSPNAAERAEPKPCPLTEVQKRPVRVHAWLWDGNVDWRLAPEEVQKAVAHWSPTGILIPTLEGNHTAKPGDYIIKGVKGEMYPIKPDIFAMTYDSKDPAPGAVETPLVDSLAFLQANLPWTIHYDRDFRASPMAHKDFGHALLHVTKACGKIAAAVNDAEHAGTDWNDPKLDDYVADLVLCALRMANTIPGRKIDLGPAVVRRIETKNDVKLSALRASARSAPPVTTEMRFFMLNALCKGTGGPSCPCIVCLVRQQLGEAPWSVAAITRARPAPPSAERILTQARDTLPAPSISAADVRAAWQSNEAPRYQEIADFLNARLGAAPAPPALADVEVCARVIRAACEACRGTGYGDAPSTRIVGDVSRDMARDAGDLSMEGPGVEVHDGGTECEYCGRPIAALRKHLSAVPSSGGAAVVPDMDPGAILLRWCDEQGMTLDDLPVMLAEDPSSAVHLVRAGLEAASLNPAPSGTASEAKP